MHGSGRSHWAGQTEALGWPQTMQGARGAISCGPQSTAVEERERPFVAVGLGERKKSRVGRPGVWESRQPGTEASGRPCRQ